MNEYKFCQSSFLAFSIFLSSLSFLVFTRKKENTTSRLLSVIKELDCVKDLLLVAKLRQEVFFEILQEFTFLSNEIEKRGESMTISDAWYHYMSLINDAYAFAKELFDVGVIIIKNLVVSGKEISKYSSQLRRLNAETMKLEEQIEKSHARIQRAFYYTREKEEIMKILNTVRKELLLTVDALKNYNDKLIEIIKELSKRFEELSMEHESLLENVDEEFRKEYLEKLEKLEELHKKHYEALLLAKNIKNDSIRNAIKDYEGYLNLLSKLSKMVEDSEQLLEQTIRKYDILTEKAKKEYEEACEKIRNMPWSERMKLREEVSNVKEMYLVAARNLDPENWEHIYELDYEFWPSWVEFLKKIRDYWEENVEEVRKTVEETKSRYELAVLEWRREVERRQKRISDAKRSYIRAVKDFENRYIELKREFLSNLTDYISRLQKRV